VAPVTPAPPDELLEPDEPAPPELLLEVVAAPDELELLELLELDEPAPPELLLELLEPLLVEDTTTVAEAGVPKST
jgi:hypothetical protein